MRELHSGKKKHQIDTIFYNPNAFLGFKEHEDQLLLEICGSYTKKQLELV